MNEGILRKYIRTILYEGFVEDFNAMKGPGFQSAVRYENELDPMYKTEHRPWSTSTIYKKKMKKLFRQYADHQFWNNEVTAIHYVSYVPTSRDSSSLDQIKDFLQRNPPNQTGRMELSCVGYLNPRDKQPTGFGFVMKKKWVTFAYLGDAWSEEIKTAFNPRNGKKPFVVVDWKTKKIIGLEKKPVRIGRYPLHKYWQSQVENPGDHSFVLIRKPIAKQPGETFREFSNRLMAISHDRHERAKAMRALPYELEYIAKQPDSGIEIMTIEDYYSNSGIPKRPDLRIDPTKVPLTRDDLSGSNGKIGELIVDNWEYDTVYCSPYFELSEELKSVLYNYNVKIIRSL
jgi:hypothetical protein